MVSESQNVNTSAISPADSSLWIATSARGLVRVGKNGKAFSYTVEKGDLQSNNIVSLTFGDDGLLWIKDDCGDVFSYSSFSGFVKQSEVPGNIAAALSGPVMKEEAAPAPSLSPAAAHTVPYWVPVLLTILLLICLSVIFFRRKTVAAPVEIPVPKPGPKPGPEHKAEPKPAPKPAPGPEPEPVEGSFYEQVYTLVMENFRNADFGVEDVAAAFGISRVHLNRKLKAENSPSPSDMIKTMRMELAAGMLKDGTHSISEVAQECGFSSASYFSSAFKEYYGVAPAAYEK